VLHDAWYGATLCDGKKMLLVSQLKTESANSVAKVLCRPQGEPGLRAPNACCA